MSPCARWAGTAFSLTVIVTVGFFFEPVWWQIVTFLPYSYSREAADAGLPNALNVARMPRAETSARVRTRCARTRLADSLALSSL